jgi:hypothetical protein
VGAIRRPHDGGQTPMNKYIYKSKKTGAKVYSDKPLKDPDLKLVREFRDGKIKTNKVIKK